MLQRIRHIILGMIDFFHRPFDKWISTHTFRYLACGGTNALLDAAIYFVAFNYLLPHYAIDLIGSNGDAEKVIMILGLPVKMYIAAFIISFSVSFPLGFILSKYIVFPHSNLGGRIQLFRYAVLVGMCLLLNYIFLKLFVGVLHFMPTPSKLLTTGLVAIFSYFSQRHFTFRVKAQVVNAWDYEEAVAEEEGPETL